MKRLFLVANWKSHKSAEEAKVFFQRFVSLDITPEMGDKHIIICPPSLLLPVVSDIVKANTFTFDISLGSQDVSPFAEGSYTGEEAASQLNEYVSYVIIGHSERRETFGETDEILERKVALAKQYNITPIYCVQGKETYIPEGVDIVAYEPVEAIGTGNPASVSSVDEVAQTLKSQKGVQYVLYGGSVTSENVNQYTSLHAIDGVLVGSESLDPDAFMQIIKKA